MEGARAAGRLADRLGGVLDHMNSAAVLRNLMVLQDSGWITTTLSEVRNRADLLIVAGGDIVEPVSALLRTLHRQPGDAVRRGPDVRRDLPGPGAPGRAITMPGSRPP